MRRLSMAPGTWAVLGALLVLANVPRLLVGWLDVRPGFVFVGEFWDSFDLPQYVEAIHEGATGRWLYGGRLWGAHADGQYPFQLEYLLAGHLFAGWTSLAVLEALRWGFQVFAVCAAVLFIWTVLADARDRAWALFFACLAGGLGWLFLSRPSTPAGPLIPMDVVTPSFNLLNGFLGAPHLALMAGCLAIYAWGAVETMRGRWRGAAGLAGLLAALEIHPFEVVSVVVAAALLILLMVRRRPALVFVAASLLLSGLMAGYLAWAASRDPVLAGLTASSLTTEVGNLPSFLIARAPVLVLAAIALWVARRHLDPVVAFLGAWALVSTVLNVQPFDEAGSLHRSLEGVSLAFGCLAALGLRAIASRWKPLVMGLCLLSPAVQTAALVLTAPGEPSDWVAIGVFRLAENRGIQTSRGCLGGDLIQVRWLVAETDLCLAGTGRSNGALLITHDGRAIIAS